jgi:hypothetical protein
MLSMLQDARGFYGIRSRKKRKGRPLQQQPIYRKDTSLVVRMSQYADDHALMVPMVYAPNGPTMFCYPSKVPELYAKIMHKNLDNPHYNDDE